MNNSYKNEVSLFVTDMLDTFGQYQNVVLDLFKCFHSLCIKNDITYFCAYGTLLGFIREGEGLPWDYDCDVMIFAKDVKKLLSCLDEQLPNDYYYVYNNNTDKYCAECIRLCKKGYTYMAFHVDIFLLVGTPNKKSKRKRFKRKILKYEKAKISLFCPFHSEKESLSKTQKVLRFFYKVKHLFFTEKRIYKAERAFANKYPIEFSDYLCVIQPFLDEYKKEWFEKSILMNNGILDYCVPVGFNEILKTVYGDFERRPSISSSFDELYKSFNIINKRQSYYENKFIRKINK